MSGPDETEETAANTTVKVLTEPEKLKLGMDPVWWSAVLDVGDMDSQAGPWPINQKINKINK